MNIAVNTRLLIKNKLEGIGWFSYENLKRITQNHPEHHFIFIFDRPFDQDFIFSSNITPIIAQPPARHPVLWYLFFDWAIPSVLQRHKADLFFSPDGWLSLRTEIPSLPVIHDLNFLHNPEWVSRLPRLYYQHFFPRYIKKATRIATVSQFSKDDILQFYDIPEDKIDVVYNGANESFTPISIEDQKKVKVKYSDGEDFFLFIGLIHPRKNLTRIFKAFDQFKIATGAKTKLLIIGSQTYWTTDTKNAYETAKHMHDIIFLGRKEWNELHYLLASSLALVFPSLFEGFGIPVVEAMCCERPVITSNVTSLPEIGGDAALYVDPYSVDSIRHAMMQIFNDAALRSRLIDAGIEQRKKFTWEQSAIRTWDSIEKVIKTIK